MAGPCWTWRSATNVARKISLMAADYLTFSERLSRFRRSAPRELPDRMGLGVEDDVAEVERVGQREEQVEIFESFGEEKALHRVRFFFGDDVLQRRVRFVRATVLDEVAPKRLAHLEKRRLVAVVVKIVSGLNDLGTKWITGCGDLTGAIVVLFWFDTGEVPHGKRRLLQLD